MDQDSSSAVEGLTLEVDRDHVGWLTLDQPESSVNILSASLMRRLDGLLSQLESRIANGQLVALVIRSGKKGTFIAGADVREIASLPSAAAATAASAEGQRVFRRLERLGVPTIAVVDGICLGGGTELILHCAYRIASDRDSSRIGLPEVRLGIIPGFGGSVRLPRLCGIQNALGMILTGRPASPRRARLIGLVDRVVGHQRLGAEVQGFAADVIAGNVPPGGARRSLTQKLLEGTALGRRILFGMARRRTAAETKGFYPAPLRALEVIQKSWGLAPDEAYAAEARVLGELALTEVSRNLVRVFLLTQDAKRALPPETLDGRRRVGRAAVLGAGVMGGAIAELIAANDTRVLLKDIDQGALDAGLRHANSLLQKAARARVFTNEQASLKFALITGTLAYDGFEEVDLTIEAVVERMPVKQQVLREVEAKVDDTAVLATNTSSLSVGEMAAAVDRPERVVGLHFFNPVHRMPLVEVVRTDGASPEAMATAFGFALDMGKTPVIVADRPGFLVNRLLGPYLNEAAHLLEEGATIRQIDAALTDFGMPMGPCRLLDEIGLDIAGHASRELAVAFGGRMEPSGLLDRMIDDGRLGRKNGRGFYLYDRGKSKEPDPSLASLLAAPEPGTRPAGAAAGAAADAAGGPETGEMVRRCLYLMVNEAAYALAEQVVDGADQVDLAMIMGTGFPPFRGGLLRWADSEGTAAVHQGLLAFQAALGERFSPAPLLAGMAERDQTFTHSP
jgi:3-hydroxyacyl-CoA dehydrogenase/enoyl-CoA hydratase/3-hydroxybutyryl-CoA epimerase